MDNDIKGIKDELKISLTDKINSFLKSYIIDITIALVLIAYLLTSIATLKITVAKTLPILADFTLMLLIGAMVKSLFGRKGILMGEKNKEFLEVKKRFDETLNAIRDKLEVLDEFCMRKNSERLRMVQNKILFRVGLTLELIESGVSPKPEQLAAYKHAMNAKIENLNSLDLLSEQTSKKEDFSLGKTKASYMRSRNIIDLASSALFCAIFSIFTLEIAQDFSWVSLIWSLLQLVYFILKGTMSLMRSYEFITVEYANRLIRKTNLLIEFDNTTSMDEVLAARAARKSNNAKANITEKKEEIENGGIKD